jgi:hypothetical protein
VSDVLILNFCDFYYPTFIKWGQAVAQLVEALRYKSESRGFVSR